MNEIKLEWVDKYAPKTLDDYMLNSTIKKYFKDMIKNNNLQNFSLGGIQGAGKTTLAKVLVNEFNADCLFVKCATEGTIDVLRTKVQEFCNAMSFDGKLKIVILDELDSASSTGQNSFQLALRTLIEAAQEDCRFICTFNTIGKIFPAILSRCPHIPLKFDKKDLLLHVKKILDLEKVKYDKESLKAFIEESFHYYPDCRRIINYLQFCCNSGKLIVKLNEVTNSEKDDLMRDIVDKAINENNILNVRKFYLQSKDKLGDFVDAGSQLFNYVVDNDMVGVDGILKLTDMLWALNVVVDKESMFFGMIVALNKYSKS